MVIDPAPLHVFNFEDLILPESLLQPSQRDWQRYELKDVLQKEDWMRDICLYLLSIDTWLRDEIDLQGYVKVALLFRTMHGVLSQGV